VSTFRADPFKTRIGHVELVAIETLPQLATRSEERGNLPLSRIAPFMIVVDKWQKHSA